MKPCPKCNSSCADEDIICKNCGYLFAPAGFDDNVPPADNNATQIPNQNYGNPVPPQDPYANQGQVPPYGAPVPPQNNNYGPSQNPVPPQYGNPVPPQYGNPVPPQGGYGAQNPVPPQGGFGTQNPVPPQGNYGPSQNPVPPQYNNPVPPQYNNNTSAPKSEWYSSANANTNNGGLQEQSTNGMSIASLVLGIIGVIFSCCYGTGIIFGAISLILGIISTNKIKNSEGREKGKGLALAGIILAAFALIISIIFIVALVANRDEFVNYMQRYMNTHSYDSSSSLF